MKRSMVCVCVDGANDRRVCPWKNMEDKQYKMKGSRLCLQEFWLENQGGRLSKPVMLRSRQMSGPSSAKLLENQRSF